MPAAFGLWIWKKPSGCTIITFMALSAVSSCISLPFLILAVFKANSAESYPHHHVSLLMTIAVIQIILGLLQAVTAITSAVWTAKTTCSIVQCIQGTLYYAISTTANEKGEKVIQLKPMRQENGCLLYTSPSPRDRTRSRMPSSA